MNEERLSLARCVADKVLVLSASGALAIYLTKKEREHPPLSSSPPPPPSLFFQGNPIVCVCLEREPLSRTDGACSD